MLDLLYSNPWRSPDAWWQRTLGIQHHGDLWATYRRDSGRGARWIKQAQRFRLALSQAKLHQEQMQVLAEYPGIYQALSIYERSATHLAKVASAIEARILARQTDQDIARLNGCASETIGAYEALFFNVRDRLDNRDFILTHVLGPTIVGNLKDCRPEMLWKLFGYMGGPHVLDAIMTGFPDGSWPRTAEGVAAYFQDLAFKTVKQKAALASLSVSIDDHTCVRLLDTLVKFMAIERTGDSAGQAGDQTAHNLQLMLEGLPFVAVDVCNEKNLSPLDKCAAEMRTEEICLMAVGMPPPGIEGMQNLRFPEPV